MIKKIVCKNPWCKGTFSVDTDKLEVVKFKTQYPKQCPKCISFDTEMSSGVTWEDKEYEGDPWKGSHEIKYNIKNYK